MAQGRFQSKSARIVLGAFIALIIFSFLFTTIGTGTASVSASNIAEVGDYGITPKEFNNAYNATLQQYNQIFKGQSIPQTFLSNIQRSTLTRLESQKIILNLADQFGFVASDAEIKETIKDQEYFQTDKQFDFNKYKTLLQANNYSPKSYEAIIKNDLRTQKFYELLTNVKTSKASQERINEIKNSVVPVSIAKIEKYPLRDQIEVTAKEIKEFVANKENQAALESVYNEKRSEYQVPAKYTYRTIFFNKLGKDKAEIKTKADNIRKKLTAKNFGDTAQKESDDPATKAQKGLISNRPLTQIPAKDKAALLKLTPNQISPVYETELGYSIVMLEKVTPKVDIKLEDVKNDLAVTAIQRNQTEKLDKLYQDVVKQVQTALNEGNSSKVETLSKKYKFSFNKDAKLSKYSNSAGEINIKPESTLEIYKANKGDVKTYDRVTFSIVAAKTGEVQVTADSDDNSSEGLLGSDLQVDFSTRMIQAYREKNPVSYNPNFNIQ